MEDFVIFFSCLICLLLLVVGFVLSRDDRKQDYDDDFGSSSDVLSRFNKGFYLGSGRITRKDSYLSAGVIAASGGGKTSAFLLPTALMMDNSSLILMDPAKELHSKSAGELEQKGYKIKVLDFSDWTRSVGYNPLLRANTSTEINQLAELLFNKQLKQSKDVFWVSMAQKLTVLVFRLQKNLPIQFQNLANTQHLIKLLASKPSEMDKLFALQNELVWTDYLAMMRTEEKVLSNVMAQVQSCFRSFDDENICATTAVDTMKFENFRQQKTALFIQYNFLDADYYSFLAETLLFQLFRYYMSAVPKKNELDVFFIADEAGSVSIKNFSSAISNFRKYRMGILYAIQSKAQLIAMYGKENAENIWKNTYNKVITSGMEPEIARIIQERSGRWSFEREDGRKGTREVVTMSELIHLKDEAILLSGSLPPCKIRLKPYFNNYFLKRKSQQQTLETKSKLTGDIALFNVEAYLKSIVTADA